MLGMITVNRKQVIFDNESHSIVAEASSLRLRPGEWPQFVGVVDDKNEGFLFGPGNSFFHNEEFAGKVYHSLSTLLTLKIYND